MVNLKLYSGNMHYIISTISNADTMFYITKKWNIEANSLEEALYIFKKDHKNERILEIREEYNKD